jgi:hypothetical protein
MTLRKSLRSTFSLLALALVAVALIGAPSIARAETGFEGGLRLGYGIPLGEAAEGADLSDVIGGQIPIWIDLGYRVIDPLFIGLYFQYGIGLVGGDLGDACDALDLDCSTSDMRLGVQGHYHISPTENLDPWVGLGIGYEWMGESVEGAGLTLDSTASGIEFLDLQAGLDISVAEHVKIGPFLSFSLGQYSSVSAECDGLQPACEMVGTRDGDIEETAMHEWLMIGVRGAYVP